MTDLRDQLADAILLTERRRVGDILWRLRHDAQLTLDTLAHRLNISRSGVSRREAFGHLPAEALIEHLDALGYDLVAIRRTEHTHLRRAA